ncbi:UNVERIFIED_CONTAM: hypothetical protein HDU68_009657 [Siphonaria sp. JEL0065]|nr:hypothetical protein HDU68_009657 [Siphonaria sp. JEL0065]
MPNVFQTQEWEATYILFILYCIGLFATPFIATLPQIRANQPTVSPPHQQHHRDQEHTHSGTPQPSSSSSNIPVHDVPSGAIEDRVVDPRVMSDKNFTKMAQFARTTRSAFILIFASTVAHSLAQEPAAGATYASVVLTWISFIILFVWNIVILAGFGDSLVFETMVFTPVLFLQIINFGLGFRCTTPE